MAILRCVDKVVGGTTVGYRGRFTPNKTPSFHSLLAFYFLSILCILRRLAIYLVELILWRWCVYYSVLSFTCAPLVGEDGVTF